MNFEFDERKFPQEYWESVSETVRSFARIANEDVKWSIKYLADGRVQIKVALGQGTIDGLIQKKMPIETIMARMGGRKIDNDDDWMKFVVPARTKASFILNLSENLSSLRNFWLDELKYRIESGENNTLLVSFRFVGNEIPAMLSLRLLNFMKAYSAVRIY